MNDAMHVVLAHIFVRGHRRKPWPFPLAACPWKVVGAHHTLTLKPYRDLVKAALITKSAHTQFRQFIEAQIWQDEDRLFEYAFNEAVYNSGFKTWAGQLEVVLRTWTFEVRVHDTFFAGATITTRLTDTPDVYEMVAHYGVGDAAAAGAAFVATVPAAMFDGSSLRRSLQRHWEQLEWKRDSGQAFQAFVAEQHRLRV
ncbi:MAG: hypothetical protein WCP53_00275 [Verrucomicrobiota bacterium]